MANGDQLNPVQAVQVRTPTGRILNVAPNGLTQNTLNQIQPMATGQTNLEDLAGLGLAEPLPPASPAPGPSSLVSTPQSALQQRSQQLLQQQGSLNIPVGLPGRASRTPGLLETQVPGNLEQARQKAVEEAVTSKREQQSQAQKELYGAEQKRIEKLANIQKENELRKELGVDLLQVPFELTQPTPGLEQGLLDTTTQATKLSEKDFPSQSPLIEKQQGPSLGEVGFGLLASGAQQEKRAITKASDVNANLSDEQAKTFADLISQRNEITTKRDLKREIEQKEIQNKEADLNNTIEELKNTNVDPNRFYNNIGTVGKIGAAVAMGLGAAGAALAGGPNTAADIIRGAIDNDIKSQVANIEKGRAVIGAKQTAYQLALNKASSNEEAYNAAMILGMEQAKLKVEQLSAKANSALARTNAQQLVAQLDQKIGLQYLEYQKAIQKSAGENQISEKAANDVSSRVVMSNLLQKLEDQFDRVGTFQSTLGYVPASEAARFNDLKRIVLTQGRMLAAENKFSNDDYERLEDSLPDNLSFRSDAKLQFKAFKDLLIEQNSEQLRGLEKSGRNVSGFRNLITPDSFKERPRK